MDNIVNFKNAKLLNTFVLDENFDKSKINANNFDNTILQIKLDFDKFIEKYQGLENYIFLSSDVDLLIKTRSRYKNIKLEYYTKFFDISIVPQLVINNLDLAISYPSLTKERIDSMKELNIKVNAYIVDELDIAKLLDFWKIDYITSTKLTK